MKKLVLIAIVCLTSVFAIASPVDSTTLNLQVGASKYSILNVVDKVTGNYVTVTITNVSVQNNNPELATFSPSPNSSNSIKATGVAAGAGTAVFTYHISYVDAGDGLTKSEDKVVNVSYSVSGDPHGVKLVLTF